MVDNYNITIIQSAIVNSHTHKHTHTHANTRIRIHTQTRVHRPGNRSLDPDSGVLL